MPPRPAWVTAALNRSLTHLQAEQSRHGLASVNNSLTLKSADEDDLQFTHLRLNQHKNGIPVFGGQFTTHVNAEGKVMTMGRVFKEDDALNTTPTLNASQAVEKAKQALGYNGNFTRAPEAELMILPHWVIRQQDAGNQATLTYRVRLLVLDGSSYGGDHYYFINAQNGEAVWHYNNVSNAVGTGYTKYSGTVSFPNTLYNSLYYLSDNTKCPPSNCLAIPSTAKPQFAFSNYPSHTKDMQNGSDYQFSQLFKKNTNSWGNSSFNNWETTGADAYFGMIKTWDYFQSKHGRFGLDGNGYPFITGVHYRAPGDYCLFSFFIDSQAMLTDGDGQDLLPWVSIDVVGHEITHGITERTAGLMVGAFESGGLNESFSDIFGTAVEHYVGTINGKSPNYDFAEDVYTPGVSGDAVRYMDDPTKDWNRPVLNGHSFGNYNDYLQYIQQNQVAPHWIGGIQNKAFYTLANNPSVGRENAEKIFYRALTQYLTQSSMFSDSRCATIKSANDLFGAYTHVDQCTPGTYYAQNPISVATANAWATVGVTQ